jgi:hypothetical protein
MEQNDALRKAQGLLNMAADQSISEQERESFQDKAFDLIEKFGIDQALLNAKAEIKQKPTHMTFTITGAQARYRVVAFNSIAKALHCRSVNTNYGSSYYRNIHEVEVFGFESDLNILVMLWTSLQLQGFQEVKQIKGEVEVVFAGLGTVKKKVSTKAKRNSFWVGFGYKLMHRIEEAEKRVATEPGTDLVLYNRDQEVEDAKNAAYPDLKKGKDFEIASKAGFAAGLEAGERANIHDKAEVKNTQRELS